MNRLCLTKRMKLIIFTMLATISLVSLSVLLSATAYAESEQSADPSESAIDKLEENKLNYDDVKGILIEEDNQKVTVDDEGQLIEIDKNNKVTVLDSERKYLLKESEDGTITITDTSGKAIKIDEENKSLLFPILDFAIGIGIVIVGITVGKRKKKKTL